MINEQSFESTKKASKWKYLFKLKRFLMLQENKKKKKNKLMMFNKMKQNILCK